MLASSLLNSVTFKNIVGNYPNMWNTLHANRKHNNNKIIPYYQKFNKNHVLYLQFESDISDSITLKAYSGLTEIESFTNAYSTHYGTTDNRYYTNFVVTLDDIYFDIPVYFKSTQGASTMTSEPILTKDLTADIAKGIIKYIKYTNLDRIESDLDDRFIDWNALASTGKYLDLFIEAVDVDPNDTDEVEILEGAQSKTILSAGYYSGKILKTGGIPDYLASKIGLISSLDIFTVNDLQYIKTGEIEISPFGNSTSYQVSIKMTQKNATGINVDNVGLNPSTPVVPPIVNTPMYIGALIAAVPTETQVKTMTSLTAEDTDQTKNYSISDSRFCFAYPTIFGDLSSILDTNQFEIISGFNKTTLNFTIGANTINYTIYTLKRVCTVSNFNTTFKF